MNDQSVNNDGPIVAPPSANRPKTRRAPWIITVSAAAVLIVGGGVTAAVTGASPEPSVSMPSASAGAASVGAASTAGAAVDTTGFPTGGASPGIFTDRCSTTLRAPDDPIMMPGMTGMSMQHDFFGATKPTASSTPASLVGGATSCSTSADASAYWLPVVYQNGIALKPSTALIYWRAPARIAASVKSMPVGLTMIAGDENATAPQDARIVNWTCTRGASGQAGKAADAPHDCTGGDHLRLVITFPNCWDGHTLDGRAQRNVAYASASGACPASHPVPIPQIVFHVSYPTTSGEDITLSTGPAAQGAPVTGHADFMSGWTPSHMNADVAACIAAQTRCGPVTGADATPQGGKDPAQRSTRKSAS